MAKKAKTRKDVKAKIIPATKFVGPRYICVRCEKKFEAKRVSKYCSDKCRVAGPKLNPGTGGRVKHHGAKSLYNELEEYFAIEDKNKITPAGLLISLGLTREMWAVYEQKPQLKKICDWAKLKMEHYGTERLYDKGRVADIFFMKNMGWTDKQEIEQKEHLLIDNNLSDEQEKRILERRFKRIGKVPPEGK